MHSKHLTTANVERDWYVNKHKPIHLPPLMLWNNSLMVDAKCPPEPDRSFVKQLKQIDERLSVHWIGLYQKWGIFIEASVYWIQKFRGNTLKVYDKFPLLVDVLQDKKGNYAPLESRFLPIVNMDNRDQLKYLLKKREVAEKLTERWKRKYHDIMSLGKHEKDDIARAARWQSKDVPDFRIPVTRDIKNIKKEANAKRIIH